MTNFCYTCKHCKTDTMLGYRFARCMRPRSPSKGDPEYHLVTGKLLNPTPSIIYCEEERTNYYEYNCGTQGKYWEPKPPSYFSKIKHLLSIPWSKNHAEEKRPRSNHQK